MITEKKNGRDTTDRNATKPDKTDRDTTKPDKTDRDTTKPDTTDRTMKNRQKEKENMKNAVINSRAKTTLRDADKVKWITVTAVFMGMNIALCAFGVPVPGGHLYLNDVVICTASLLLDPVGAFIVGGVGAFLGDFLFYPLPMFVSLAAHGLQAVAISLIFRNLFKEHRKLSGTIAVLVGAVIMVTLYTLGKIYVYSTFEYAMIKLPYEIAQALIGVAGSLLLCFRSGLIDSFHRIIWD